MVKTHMSEKKYDLLSRYDVFLNVRTAAANRYYVLFLFFYKDYFTHKVVNKIMRAGHKRTAYAIWRTALYKLKKVLGFQPFFIFKHITFSMRQLFKINTVSVRNKVSYSPMLLEAHTQVSYGIEHLIAFARQLSVTDKITFADCICVVLLNSFICKAA